MIAHELTQSLMAVGTVYHVRRPREERVLYTIRGVTLRGAPRFGLVEGDEGREAGQLIASLKLSADPAPVAGLATLADGADEETIRAALRDLRDAGN